MLWKNVDLSLLGCIFSSKLCKYTRVSECHLSSLEQFLVIIPRHTSFTYSIDWLNYHPAGWTTILCILLLLSDLLSYSLRLFLQNNIWIDVDFMVWTVTNCLGFFEELTARARYWPYTRSWWLAASIYRKWIKKINLQPPVLRFFSSFFSLKQNFYKQRRTKTGKKSSKC